jgi:rhodanese-related sulfurtransferase
VSTLTIAAAVERRQNKISEFQWIDVRSASEYASGHIPGAANIPMEQIEARLDDLQPTLPIVLVCQSGKRARMVAGLLEPCRKDVTILEGGTSAWRAAGLPIVKTTNSRWSLERQVRLIAGLLILTSLLLSRFSTPYWLGLTLFVGLGLTFAGATDLCLMAAVLEMLPWNRARRCAVGNARDQECAL